MKLINFLKNLLALVGPNLRHTMIEGWLYWYTAAGVAAETYLSSEEAYKYCSPVLLFWMKLILGSSISGFNAIKAFRSMTFGRAYGQPEQTTSTTVPQTTNAKTN